MGAVKNMIPDTWFDLDDNDITKVIVRHVGFEDEMQFENGKCVSSKTFGKIENKSIKETIEKALMYGYRFEVYLKNDEVLKIGMEETQ